MLPTLTLCAKKFREQSQIIIKQIALHTGRDLKNLAYTYFLPILETWLLTRHLRKNERYDLGVYFIKKFETNLVIFDNTFIIKIC